MIIIYQRLWKIISNLTAMEGDVALNEHPDASNTKGANNIVLRYQPVHNCCK